MSGIKIRTVNTLVLTCALVLTIGCGGGSGGDVGYQKDDLPPVAKGTVLGAIANGSTYRVRANSEVVLTGKDSFSDYAPILEYTWRQTSGTAVTLVERTSNAVAFTAPKSKTNSTLTFELTAIDGNTNSDTATVTVDVMAINDVDHFLADPATPDNKLRILAALQAGTQTGASSEPVVFEIETIAHWKNRDGNLDQISVYTEQVTALFPEGFVAPANYDPLLDSRNPSFNIKLVRLNADDINKNFETQNRNRRVDPYNISTAYLEVQLRLVSANVSFELFAIDNSGASVAASELEPNTTVATIKSAIASPTNSIIKAQQLNAPSNATNNNANGALIQSWLGQTSVSILSNNALNQLGIENNVTASNYYNLIDPTGSSATLDGWLANAGFTDSNGKLISDPSIAHALYVNNYDLGFGRDMYLRKADNGNVYSYVTNYPTVETGMDQRLEFAVVAMEYSENPDPNGINPKIVKFLAFIQDERSGKFVRVNSMNFDGRGEKFLPNVCTACHQSYPGIGTQFTDLADADIGATFIPWDLDSFLYTKANNPHLVEPTLVVTAANKQKVDKFSRENQEAEFKKLNLGALATYLGEPARNAASIELVHGWYGDAALELPIDQLPDTTKFDGTYTQAGWQGEEDLYHKVYARNCRICHTQMANEKTNFDSYEELLGNKNLVNYVFEQGLMPLARLSMDRFWVPFQNGEQSSAELLRQHIIARGDTALAVDTLPGAPQAKFSHTPSSPTIEQTVVLDAKNSKFAQSYAWAITQKPDQSSTSLNNATGLTSSFRPDAPGGNYEVTLTVTDDSGDQASLSQSITAQDRSPSADCFEANTSAISDAGQLTIPVVSQMTQLGDGQVTINSITAGSLGAATISSDKLNINYQLNDPFVRGVDQIDFQLSDVNGSLSSPGENCTGVARITVDTTTAGTFAPSALVASVSASLDTSAIELAWQAPTAVVPDSYKIYRNGIEIADQAGRTYIDTGLAAATLYRYSVRSAINGFVSNPTADSSATTFSLDPSNLLASHISSTDVALTWNAPLGNRANLSDPTQYQLARSAANYPATPATPSSVIATNIASNSFNDSGLTPGTSYRYAVSASTSLETSALSAGSTATTAPLPVANLALLAGDDARTQVQVNWSAPAGHVSHYVVARREGTGAYAEIATPSTTQFVDLGLNESTTYTYQVTSAAGTTYSTTQTSSAITTASAGDGQPSNFTADVNTAPNTNASQIILSWTPPAAFTPDSYILRRDNNDGNFVPVSGCCVGSAVSFTDTGLNPGSTHNYRLIAEIGGVQSPIVTDIASTLSLTPNLNSATINSSSQITLAWTAPIADVESYTLSRAGLSQTNATSGFSDTGLTPGKSYLYTLTAHQGSSTGTSMRAAATAPTAPSGLTLTAASISSIQLNWTAATGNDSDGAIVYDIYRSDDGYGSPIATNVSGTSYLNTGLIAGTNYGYRVFAKANNELSKTNTSASIATLANAPTLATASAPGTSTSQISVSWTASSGAAVTGYNVYRSTDGYTTPIVSNHPSTSYSNTGLATATAYSYRIKAVTSGGESANSNTASGATFPAQPSGVTGTVNSASQITVAWSANGNPATVMYTVTPSSAASGSPTTNVSQAITGLTGYTSYTFRVVATANGLSSSSSATSPSYRTHVSYANNVQTTCESCHSAGGHHGLNGTAWNASTNPNGVSPRFPACMAPTAPETRCDAGATMPLYATGSVEYQMINQWIAEGRNTAN